MRNQDLGSDTVAFDLKFDASDDYADIRVTSGSDTFTTLRIYANGTIAPPSYSGAELSALDDFVEGQLVYNTTDSKLNVYTGAGFEEVTSS